MSTIRMGCQFYTWQMSGEEYVGKLPHIFEVVSRAGFEGVEFETCMMGHYDADPSALKALLDERKLELGAVALARQWQEPDETEEERREADRLFDYLGHFDGVHLVLAQMPGDDRSDLRERQENAIACTNAVAARAANAGIVASFHPNSPEGSVFRIEEDYRILLDGLNARVVGFAPDAGHIANGGMDVLEVFRAYRPLIRHVHFKDIAADGRWAAMGAGVVDFPAIVAFLHETGYDGWIMVEEESAQAEQDPDGVTLTNGRYVAETLLPIVG